MGSGELGKEIKYRVVLSGRRSISLIVSPDKGVVVRAPYGTSLKSIERFVIEKSGWIRKHLEKYSGLKRINQGKAYSEGEPHLFMGREHKLQIRESGDPSARLSDGVIEVSTRNTRDTLMTRAILNIFYRQKAQEYLSARFYEIADRLREQGFFPSGFCVKPLKSRWGSCSSRGSITISSELIKLDPLFADYVIIHELCHLKHHNHGKEFYNLLGKLVPDYKLIRKELRKYLTR